MANTATKPIKDRQIISNFLSVLKAESEKYYVIAKFQLNTGLRISDIIDVRVSDLFDTSGRWRQHFAVQEKKTEKKKLIKLNMEIKSAIEQYKKNNEFGYDDFLFPGGQNGHISYTQVYRVWKDIAKRLNIEGFATHSCRKTFGFFSYIESKFNLALIMSTYGHINPKDTLRYIGIDQDEKDELYSAVRF